MKRRAGRRSLYRCQFDHDRGDERPALWLIATVKPRQIKAQCAAGLALGPFSLQKFGEVAATVGAPPRPTTMLIRLLIVAAVAAAAYQYFGRAAVPDFVASASALPRLEFSHKLQVAVDPIQGSARGAAALRIKQYVVTPVASFQVAGRVLSAEHYRADREADLAPVDLAMGWGPMADPAVLKSIDISQGGRFYHWHVAQFPIPAQATIEHSANMHLIPASRDVAAQIAAVEQGPKVRFKGYLVNIMADDGWHWQSSMTRQDQGAGACEVVLVDAMETL
jgi:hypothetical protein